MILTLPEKMLIYEEGLKTKSYKCSNGYPTIGVGHKILPTDPKRYTTVGLKSRQEAVEILKADMKIAERDADKYAWFKGLNQARRAVILSMIFQMGAERFAKFEQFIRAMELGKFTTARNEMLDSKWAKSDSPARAKRHAAQMLSGGWMPEYTMFKVEV